ncbi:MAG: Na+/H+ antiporter NhaC family protein [Muribaculum sp.]|nr:Na+/H+ antiporter NhaC family protein [Muribaculaceae bacterium]MCM1081816.1 Na+/H+ antiporter NhaC family protein [Muribaculum sp.]
MTHNVISLRRGLLAISPMIVFLLSYVVVSVAVGDFYRMPLSVSLIVAAVWAAVLMRGNSLQHRVEVFSRDAGSPTVMYMIWIFILAGAFASLAREAGAVQAVVDLAVRFLPQEMLIPGLFVAACFISLSIGTSVGTVVALTPLAVELAQSEMASVPFYVAVVLGGAFFGDNLSFISDTTIAATRTQGCRMDDKFRANLFIVLPAALAVLAIYIAYGIMNSNSDVSASVTEVSSYPLVLPYLLVIGTALAGINVILVLGIGIVSTVVLALIYGNSMITLLGFMGSGVDSVGNLTIVTLLAAGLLGLIKELGGISFILQVMTSRLHSARGAQGGIAALVGIVNLCTANNTVAIITVGELARDISKRFGIDPRKTASLLDTCSCITQSLIPYGAQTLLATSLAGISPISPWPYMYYSWALIVMVALSIVFRFPRRYNH